jgi:transposase, IS30 family
MPGRHLSESERYHIEEGFKEGLTLVVMARRLGRSLDCIRDERDRNPTPYVAAEAHLAALKRRQMSAANHPVKSAATWSQIERRLMRGESAEQVILARARYGACPVSLQGIYDHIERDKQAGGVLCEQRRRQPRRRPRKDGRAKSWAHQAKPIRQRPISAYRRHRVGHLELDSMCGKRRDQVRALITVDRLSGAVQITRVVGGDAKRTASAFRRMIKRTPYLPILTITTDRGQEFAALPAAFPGLHFVCDPHQPNQRGLCENTIGLIRQYFPKNQSLDSYTQADFDRVAQILNNRPRKRLNGRTPFQVLSRRISAVETRT